VTITAIEQFQRGLIGGTDALGVVTPGGTGSTLHALQSAMPVGFSVEKLEGIMVHASAAAVARYFTGIVEGMAAGDMNTSLRRSHFLAQIGQESGELRYSEEIATGEEYEGRQDLGNAQKGDGVRFKGRGLIQLTGRANYTAYGKARGQNFVDGNGPERIAAEPALAVDVAVWFWTTHNLNALADKDDVVGITRAINGGLNGLSGRERILGRAKWFLVDSYPDPAMAGLIHAMQAAGEDEIG